MSGEGAASQRGISATAALAVAVLAALLALAAPAQAARVANGDFERGKLSGFAVVTEGNGSWYAYSTADPPPESCSEGPTAPDPPPQGTFAATTDQGGPGSRVLYQDIALEPGAEHELSFLLYYKNLAGTFFTPKTLDPTASPNQQYRVDILKPSAGPFSVRPGKVLARVFRTDEGDPPALGPTRIRFDLSRFAGQTVRLRFAQVDNQNCFSGSVDDIAIRSRAPGGECTIRRGDGNDIVRGTPGPDVICTGGGNDIVYGLGGNDVVRAGAGADIVHGGDGRDGLEGNSGADILKGEDGADTLRARDGVRGNDASDGGEGSDSCDSDPRDREESCG